MTRRWRHRQANWDSGWGNSLSRNQRLFFFFPQNDPDKEYNMPKDGTVHELTSNVGAAQTLQRWDREHPAQALGATPLVGTQPAQSSWASFVVKG